MGTGIDDELLLSLLQCCGSVVKWKRTTDPVTGESKAFGFCDYSTGELTRTRTRTLSLSLSQSLSLSLTLTLATHQGSSQTSTSAASMRYP